MRQKIFSVLIMAMLVLFLELSAAHPSAASMAFVTIIMPTPVPGLIIHGTVRLENGEGVPGIKIYKAFASYQGSVIATTDAAGYYQSKFIWIPGDEMVRVYVDRSRFLTIPDSYYWRHYTGVENRELNFTVDSVLDHKGFSPIFILR